MHRSPVRKTYKEERAEIKKIFVKNEPYSTNKKLYPSSLGCSENEKNQSICMNIV